MTANQVDAGLAASDAEVGTRLLALAEDQWFDRKSAQIAAKDLGPPLIAFANAEGGTIVIGLSKGKVQGFQEYETRLNDIRQASIDFTRSFQDHEVRPRMAKGRSMEREAHRVASVTSVRPNRRRAQMARLRRAAIILGPDRVLTWDLSS